MLLRIEIRHRMIALGGLCLSNAVLAADKAAPVISGMGGQPDAGLPSMGRMIVAVVITLGLMVGALFAMRRYLPNITLRRSPGTLVKVLGRTHVTPGLQAHVLEIAATRVLVVESRRGLSVTVLPDTLQPGTGSGDSNSNTNGS